MSDVTSITDGAGFTMTPTQSGWENFECWNEAERSDLIERMEYTTEQMSVFSSFHFKTDDYTIESLAFAMVLDKVFGMKADLFDFYDGASSLIAQETTTAIFHFQVLEQDFDVIPGVDGITGAGVSKTQWLMESESIEQIQSELDDECVYHLDEWQTFAKPQVVEHMSSPNEIQVSPDEKGQFACGELDGCINGDSTWYPPQCEFPANNCAVLLQFLPEDDLMNRRIILENNLLLVIKYMGSSLSKRGQSNFRTFHEGDFRVIFQMRSIDLQSRDQFGWTRIPLPPNDSINVDQTIFRLRPAWLMRPMIPLYVYHDYLPMWFGSEAVEQVTDRIIDAVQWGMDDTPDLRMQLVCDHLKENDFLFIFFGLTMAQTEAIIASNCDDLSDETLEFIAGKSDQELLFGPAANSAYYNRVDGVADGYKAIFAKMHCILKHEEDRNGDLYTFGHILSGFAVICLFGSAIFTFKWRKEKIIMASSIKMLGIIFLGAAITLSYILFPRYDRLSDCHLRKYVLVNGIALMFAALEAKTRRLSVIQQSIKQLKRVKITDKDLVLRVSGITLCAVVYLTVLVLVWPIEIRQRVINRERMLICEWNDTAETLYKVLFALIVLALSILGRESWSLRATNKLYNELSILRNISTASLLSILLCDCHFQNKVDRTHFVFDCASHRRILTRRVGGREFVQIHFGVVCGDIIGVVGHFCVNAAQICPNYYGYCVQSRFFEFGHSYCIEISSDRPGSP